MTLDENEKTRLCRLATRDRKAQEAAKLARADLYAALMEAREHATVRELASVLGISHQRVHELVTVRNRRRAP